MRLFFIFLFGILFWIPSAFGFQVFEVDGKLVIEHPTQGLIMPLPESMRRASSYRLMVYPHSKNGEGDWGGEGPPPRAESKDSAVKKANQLYYRGNYAAALEILLEAYDRFSGDARVSAMLGSIYYKLKDYDEARRYWTESLSIRPNQPQLKSYLKKLPGGYSEPSLKTTSEPSEGPAEGAKQP